MTVEVLAESLEQAVIDLKLKAVKTFDSKEYQVWEIEEDDFERICNIKENEWKKEWGMWRYALGSNMACTIPKRYNINRKHIKAFDGMNRSDSDSGFDDGYHPRRYSDLLEYLSKEIGASQPRNVCAICVDLAKINGIKMSELFKKYYETTTQ